MGVSTGATLGVVMERGVAAEVVAAETNAASLVARTRVTDHHILPLDNERGSRYTVLHSRGHLSLELL